MQNLCGSTFYFNIIDVYVLRTMLEMLNFTFSFSIIFSTETGILSFSFEHNIYTHILITFYFAYEYDKKCLCYKSSKWNELKTTQKPKNDTNSFLALTSSVFYYVNKTKDIYVVASGRESFSRWKWYFWSTVAHFLFNMVLLSLAFGNLKTF